MQNFRLSFQRPKVLYIAVRISTINYLFLQHFKYKKFDRMSDQPLIHHLPQTLTVKRDHNQYAETVFLEIDSLFNL